MNSQLENFAVFDRKYLKMSEHHQKINPPSPHFYPHLNLRKADRIHHEQFEQKYPPTVSGF